MSKFEQATPEQLRAAIELNMEDELFFGTWDVETDTHVQGEVYPILLCNDTFAYACADGENVEWEDCPMLLDLYRREGWPALVRWISDKRGREPLQEVQKRMDEYQHMRSYT